MDVIIDTNQAAFVLARMKSDNIVLGHELVKGCGRKYISPRYMLKVDMHKAYDFVE